MKVFAVDLGGTMIKLALVDKGEVLSRYSLPAFAERGLKSALSSVAEFIRKNCPDHNAEAFSFAFPGIVDNIGLKPHTSYGKYLDSAEVSLVKWAKNEFGLPVAAVENDANCAVLGESYNGVAKGEKNVVMMILGTGVGTAAIVNGELVRGVNNKAGCLGGHSVIYVDGRQCNCGNRGCVEAHASTWALPQIAREDKDFLQSMLKDEQEINFRALKACAERGDKLSLKIFENCAKAWGHGLVNLIYSYDPEVVVLSGGVLNCRDLILKPIANIVKGRGWREIGALDIRVADKPDESVVKGLSYLAERYFSRAKP